MSSVEAGPPDANIEGNALHLPVETASQLLTVCLAGAPNAGKTALMNALTGGSFRTANYPGVTVTLSRGKSKAEFGPQVLLVDLYLNTFDLLPLKSFGFDDQCIDSDRKIQK